jgi:ribosomal protein S17E
LLLANTGVRRNKAKLITVYKIHNNLVPTYLQDILPSIRNTVSGYVTRNSSDYSLPKCRLELFNKSFIPDTVEKWNNLSTNTRDASSITSFKKHIQNSVDKPPRYFSFGKRFINVIHTRLRHNCIK